MGATWPPFLQVRTFRSSLQVRDGGSEILRKATELSRGDANSKFFPVVSVFSKLNQLKQCMCVYMCVHKYLLCICVCMCMYVCHICCVYVILIYIHVYKCILCMYIRVYVHMCMCKHLCICMHLELSFLALPWLLRAILPGSLAVLHAHWVTMLSASVCPKPFSSTVPAFTFNAKQPKSPVPG